MQSIEPQIKNYIDVTVQVAVDVAVTKAVDKASSRFETVMRHEIGLLQEFWKHEFALATEILKDKPGREEVREIVRDELRYHALQR